MKNPLYRLLRKLGIIKRMKGQNLHPHFEPQRNSVSGRFVTPTRNHPSDASYKKAVREMKKIIRDNNKLIRKLGSNNS